MLDETQYDDSEDFEVESQNDASHWDHANAWNGEILLEEEPVLLELAVDDDGIPVSYTHLRAHET